MDSVAVIETRGLVKYYGKQRAVDGLDLRVERGSVFGFLGPNGAGKSTTIRLLLDMIRPDAGEALVLGRRVRRDRKYVLSRVGALVERPDLYDYLSGRRHLELLSCLSGRNDARRIDEVLELVGLSDRQHSRVNSYSHGMRQRLGLAQALLPGPELLILDEPANGLDPAGLVDVRDLLRHVVSERGMTVLVSSHILSEVEMICSHVGLMVKGRLVMQGAVGELLSSGDAMASIEVSNVAEATKVASAVKGVSSAIVREGKLVVHGAHDTMAAVNAALVKAGHEVSALIPRRASLEERYMAAMDEAGRSDTSEAAPC